MTIQKDQWHRKVTLGWLRVALAMMVVNTHYNLYGHILNAAGKHFHFSGKLIFAGDGCLAVTGFFVLSGFLVAYILERRYPSNSVHDFFHFTLSRYLRIYPLFLILLFIYLTTSFVLAPHLKQGGDLLGILGTATLLPYGIYDFFQKIGRPLWLDIRPGFWVSPWTLPLDIAFYPIGFLLHKNKKVLYMIFSLLVAYFIFAWLVAPSPGEHFSISNDPWWDDNFYSTAPPNLLAFISGMISCYHGAGMKGRPWLLALSSVIILYVCYTPFGLSVFAQDVLAIIAFSVLVSELAKNGKSRFESFMGSFTFTIFLLHEYVLYVLQILTPLTHARLKIAAFLLDLVLSALVAVFVEEMFVEKRRHRWISSLKDQESALAGIEFKPAYAYIALALVSCSIVYYVFSFLVPGR
jgi:peptidoglycan/LPS O-acetylase OafA/YrhL